MSERSRLLGSENFHSFKEDSNEFDFGSQGGLDKGLDSKNNFGSLNGSGDGDPLNSARVMQVVNRIGGSHENLMEFGHKSQDQARTPK